jgi:aminoglycoside/choline kinase family phosphotransferase
MSGFSSRRRPIRANSSPTVVKIFNHRTREFLKTAGWNNATRESITGDASARKYFRLGQDNQSAILMDASQNRESVAPFIQINLHLQRLGFSVPAILARDDNNDLLLLEDFGDATFARLLDNQDDAEKLYTLATDVLITLHQNPGAVPTGLRTYHAEKMLADIELFLEWCTPMIDQAGRKEFHTVWREVLPVAHQVPASLLLRDYHVANLMLLSEREGVRQAGLLDFQDAYQGPITYDLASLLEDARRDVPENLREKMVARYLARSPALDRKTFETSLAILAALRHTRVLAIFERLSRHEGRHHYQELHSPRVERLLQRALAHPRLAGVKQWMERYAG